MSDSTTSTIIGVVIGAGLGIIASIVVSDQQKRSRKAELRKRLKEELGFIKDKIDAKMERGTLSAEAFHTEFFELARGELALSTNAETWESVILAYEAINSLRISDQGVQSRGHYDQVIGYIIRALRNL